MTRRGKRRSAPVRNVRQIAKLEAEHLHQRSWAERVAGLVTRAAGTAVFAVAHLVWFAGWILVNTRAVSPLPPFDPFPFSLLTTIVSLEAIFLSIWILISQNQMTRQADRRAHLDLQVNLLAEQESTATLQIIRRLAQKLGVEVADIDRTLATKTDVKQIVTVMDRLLPDAPGPNGATRPPAAMRT
jgi:uncharacterized membrane protein